ncbi:MAG: hypothetical protein WBM39_10325 [Parasphingorhabdus sp.]
MKNLFYGAIAASAFMFGPAVEANESVVTDPTADADCLISLVLLMDAAEKEDEDSIFAIALYYFGRLGGAGYADTDFIASRMGRFYDDENLYLAKSQDCASNFERESRKFDELAKAVESD